MRNYTRWQAIAVASGPDDPHPDALRADLLGMPFGVTAFPGRAVVELHTVPLQPPLDLSPDEARLLGVRLIEAAALADGDRAIRRKKP